MKTNAIYSSKNIILKMIFVFLCLAISIFIVFGCRASSVPERGDLPYYSLANPLFSFVKVGTLEQEYENSSGAVIIKLIGNPQYYENDIYLEPGSAEEKIYLKSGATSPNTNKYYTFEATVEKVIDDRGLSIRPKDTITLKNVYCFSINDPLYQYQQVNQSQEYMIFLEQEDKDIDKNIFWYSIRAAYYVKDGVVFSTNDEESIDSYSGKEIDEFADVIKNLK
jgi:hypothetical protein